MKTRHLKRRAVCWLYAALVRWNLCPRLRVRLIEWSHDNPP